MPENLHGLSHREFGDHSAAFALLSETASAAMGRFRGRTDTAVSTSAAARHFRQLVLVILLLCGAIC
jgi:hypothetical protein